jgi:hypothetical protein
MAQPGAVVSVNLDTQEAALAAYPQLQRIIDLRAAGWRFSLVSYEGITQVKGIYVWHTTSLPWGDLIQIRNSDDAAAIRLNPLKELVWKHEGDMAGAIDALLELPHPDHQTAPRLAIGTLRGLWTP